MQLSVFMVKGSCGLTFSCLIVWLGIYVEERAEFLSAEICGKNVDV